MRTTPDNITQLEPNEIFVFGSNLRGIHGRGAAKDAIAFGAKAGVSRGFSGATYAIPTKDEALRTLPLIYIGNRVHQFLIDAAMNPHLTFLVTAIGTGLAGYKPENVAPLFFVEKITDNVILPESFWRAARPQFISNGGLSCKA